MDSLIKIFEICQHTDKYTYHDYHLAYDRLFARIRKSARNILEIGVCEGGCLWAFSNYFENATIYGIDVNMNNCIAQIKNNINIKLFKTNAYNPENFLLNEFKNLKFDVIIDDCLHDKNHQISAFDIYSSYLINKGMYIIEDVIENNVLDIINYIYPKTCKVFNTGKIVKTQDNILICVREAIKIL